MKYNYLDCLALFGVGGAHPGGLQLTKHMLANEKIDESKSILDVGCGTGQTSAYISQQYRCQVTALDIHKIMLEKAQQRFTGLSLPVRVVEGSVEALPFANSEFDFLLSESVTGFTDVSLTLPEYTRVLKPDGMLLAVEMVLEKPFSEDDRQVLTDFYGIPVIYTEIEWYNLFNKAGFNKIIIEKYKSPFDENNPDYAADFSPSEHIDEEFYDIFEQHQHYTKVYKESLGFRIFKCKV